MFRLYRMISNVIHFVKYFQKSCNISKKINYGSVYSPRITVFAWQSGSNTPINLLRELLVKSSSNNATKNKSQYNIKISFALKRKIFNIWLRCTIFNIKQILITLQNKPSSLIFPNLQWFVISNLIPILFM